MQVDHVEIFVPSREQAARWYERALGADHIQDHGKALSVYFTDPWGNPLEVTTYDHEAAREGLTA